MNRILRSFGTLAFIFAGVFFTVTAAFAQQTNTAAPAAVDAYLANLSTLAFVPPASTGVLIGGVVVSQPSTEVLVRGIGQGLIPYGNGFYTQENTISEPDISQYNTAGKIVWANALWNIDADTGLDISSTLLPIMNAVGAFKIPLGVPGLGGGTVINSTGNSGGVRFLDPGDGQTFKLFVGGAGPDVMQGYALLEFYLVHGGLANLSARNYMLPGTSMTGGLVIEGSQKKADGTPNTMSLLIRADGPGLTKFNVGRVLKNPTIELYAAGGAMIASNSDWSEPVVATSDAASLNVTVRQATSADFAAVGAFALTAGDLDSAMVVTAPPGSYTAIVTGSPGDEGNVLLEIYTLSSTLHSAPN